jgi:hypothetical protein
LNQQGNGREDAATFPRCKSKSFVEERKNLFRTEVAKKLASMGYNIMFGWLLIVGDLGRRPASIALKRSSPTRRRLHYYQTSIVSLLSIACTHEL